MTKCKYADMVRENKMASERLVTTARKRIQEMVEDGECINITYLAEELMCSRAFFYKNPVIRKAIDDARIKQTQIGIKSRRVEAINDAIRKENDELKVKVRDLENEIDRLRNEKLISEWEKL